MATALYWLQTAGAILSVILTAGALLAGLYTTVRDTPEFWRRLTGAKPIEDRLERLHADHRVAQELAKQQAQEFNQLAHIVANEHDVPEADRPFINPTTIDRELIGDDVPDFTRGGGRSSND